jgi:hypothetical protein
MRRARRCAFPCRNQQTHLASQFSRLCEAYGVQRTKSHLLEQCAGNVWNEKYQRMRDLVVKCPETPRNVC